MTAGVTGRVARYAPACNAKTHRFAGARRKEAILGGLRCECGALTLELHLDLEELHVTDNRRPGAPS